MVSRKPKSSAKKAPKAKPKRQKPAPKPKEKTPARRKPAARRRKDQHPGLVTRAEAARQLGVAPARINRWVEDGAPVAIPGHRGHSAMYDLEALRAWVANRRADSRADISLAAQRAKESAARTSRLEMENRLRLGELVERHQTVAEGQAAIGAMKARLLRVPRQAVLRGVPREHEPILKALIVDALRELASWRTVEDAERAAEERRAS